MLCKTDDKAESESYWAGLIAAAIQQAELVTRVCAQCLFTAGGKDPAGIECHRPHSALQKGKGSVTFLSHSPSAHVPPAEHCSGCRGENGALGLMTQAMGGWRDRRQEQPWLEPHHPLARRVGWVQEDTSSSLGKKRVGWMYLNPLLREMGTLRPTNGHGCFGVLPGQDMNPRHMLRHTCSLILLFWFLETVSQWGKKHVRL